MNWVRTSVLLIAFSLAACGDNSDKDSSQVPETESRRIMQEQIDQAGVAPIDPNPQSDFSLFAYYPYDDKHHDTGGSVSKFLVNRSAELKQGKKTYNLIRGKSKLPINGEFNPATDIWLCVELRPDQKASALNLKANQELLQPDTVIESWCWYKLAIRHWERLARPIRKKDIPNIYNAEYLKQVDSLGLDVQEMFTVGEIIYLEAAHQKDTIHSYLRMRYGE